MTPKPDTSDVLHAVLQLSPDMIALSEYSGRVLYVNAAGRDLVGLHDDDPAENFYTADFFTPTGLQVSAEVEAALNTQGRWRGLSELRHFVTGEAIAVMVSTFVVHRGDDASVVVASVLRDHRPVDAHSREQRAATEAVAQYGAEQKAVGDLAQLALDGDEQHVMEAAVVAASTMIGVERAMITRAPHATGDSCGAAGEHGNDVSMTVVAASGLEPHSETFPMGTRSLMGFVALTGEVVVCADRLVEDRFDTSVMAAYGMRSGIGVPIIGWADGPWGVVSVHSADARDYGDREVMFLRTIAGVLSSALRRYHLDRELRERSMRDDLTGLPNRALAYERIDDALVRSRASSRPTAVLLLDIDNFKIVNDSLGHEAGDRALLKFAQRLSCAVRPQDTVARLGGDEFLIVCEQIEGVGHAKQLARAVAEALTGSNDTDLDAASPLTASIGVAVSEPQTTRRELIHCADLAMYRAKDTSVGSHAVFDNDDVYDAQRIRTLSVDLRAALRRGELTMHYQPLVDLATDRVVAVEALARWDHSTLGAISPTEFVAVAERTGLAEELGIWALTTATRHAARWRDFTDITVRVNVSALQLRNPEFPDRVAAILDRAHLPATALGLEITETVWVDDTARVAETLTELHRMNVALLLDDMGRGHSSFSYLDRYPVFDCFKIDKSFISALPGPRPQAIVAAIVGIARAYDVTVVAEGVETAEQLSAVRATGCDLAQGYLFGRPLNETATTTLLRAAMTPNAKR
ncbi:MAG: putative bifunctional diguanylate cyclase/phosphodiesterase [Rhodococcus sp. (in: high G+C Gram-positive bacteria)]